MKRILYPENIRVNDHREMVNYKNILLRELRKIKLVTNKVGRPYTLNSTIVHNDGGDENYIKVRISHDDFSNSWKNASNNWNDENKQLSNTKVNGPRKRAAATMLLNVIPQYHSQDIPTKFYYMLGRTRPAFRGRGLGLALRGVIAKAAADVGLKLVTQFASKMNKTQYRKPNNRPISGIVMTKLGSTHTLAVNGSEYHTLNSRKSNVRNKIKKVYDNFVLYRNK